MPPHYGHVFAVETALAHCEKMFLLVYTMRNEPLRGYERYLALKEHFANEPRLRVVWVEKDLPQEPHEHPDFWNIWKEQVIADTGGEKIDCFFGSENYVKIMGEVLGCDHFIVDIERKIVPISGTLCRNCTSEEWEHIIPEYRSNMVKKICFVGGESTGKTTLTRIMAKVFSTNYVLEYGRKHCNVKPPSEFEIQDYIKISQTQQEWVKETVKASNHFLFCDTDAIVTQAFHQLYKGKPSVILDAYISEDNYYHYFLLAPTIDFHQDGTREFEAQRQRQFDIIHEMLLKWNRSFTVITEPDLMKRVEKVKFLINTLSSSSEK